MRNRLTIGAIVLLACEPSAHAGNDDELFVGNRAAVAGGAVSATVADSSATWYNPAGLGAVRRSQIDVSGTAYTVRLYSAPRFYRPRAANPITDRSPDAVRDSLLFGTGDFYGGTLGVEWHNEHWLDRNESAPSLAFSTVLAIRYAFSDGRPCGGGPRRARRRDRAVSIGSGIVENTRDWALCWQCAAILTHGRARRELLACR